LLVAICGLSLLLVLILAPRVFLQVLWFSSLHKNNISKFQLDQDTERGPAIKPAKADVTSSPTIVIYLICSYLSVIFLHVKAVGLSSVFVLDRSSCD